AGGVPGRRGESGGGGDENPCASPGDSRSRRSRDAASPFRTRLCRARRTEEAGPGARRRSRQRAHGRYLEADRRLDRLPLAVAVISNATPPALAAAQIAL